MHAIFNSIRENKHFYRLIRKFIMSKSLEIPIKIVSFCKIIQGWTVDIEMSSMTTSTVSSDK